MTRRDYHNEMAPYFVEDAQRFLQETRAGLAKLQGGDEDRAALDDAVRALHGLKGAAGLFKQEEIHGISTDLESLLEVSRSLLRAEPESFSGLCTFVEESLLLLDQLVSTVGGDTSGNPGILASFKEMVSTSYGGYLENFWRRGGDAGEGASELVDPEILACFKEEAQEIFTELHEVLERLEGDRSDGDSLRHLARLFHTLKGSSGFAGLDNIQGLAKIEQECLESVLESGEALDAAQLTRVRETTDRMEEDLWGRATSVVSSTVSGPAKEPENVDEELVEVFLEEAGEYLEEIDAALAGETGDWSPDAVERLAKLFHTIKGSAGVVGLTEASRVAKDANDLLESLVSEGLGADHEVIAVVRENASAIKAAVGLGSVGTSSDAVVGDDDDGDLDFFSIDARENLESFTQGVLAYEKNPTDRRFLEEMLRAVHTIKGASTLVGLSDMVTAAGALEDFLGRVVDGAVDDLRTPDVVDALFTGADTVSAILQRAVGQDYDLEHAERDLSVVLRELEAEVRGKRPMVLDTAGPDLRLVDSEDEVEVDDAVVGSKTATRPSAPEETALPAKTDASSPETTGSPTEKDRKERQTIRIDSSRLNQVMNLVGELITSRTRLSTRLSGLAEIRDELGARKDRLLELVNDFQFKYEFGQTVSRLGQVLGEQTAPEFSELEFDRYDDFNILSRGLMEITSDVSEIMSQLDSLFREVAEETNNVSKVTSSMQHEVTQLRMVPAATLFDRLRRPIRDAARREGKEVEITCVGEETELDKAIIDDLFKPFIHLVRNAVSHGIESAAERRAGSKVPVGTIALKAFQEGNNVVLEVHDDGAGIDMEAVERRGRELGLLRSSDELTNDEILSLIFRSGFSTRSEVSAVSGRGVGMDAVADTINRLNGSITIQSVSRVGTKVVVRLPLTLAINQALIVSVCEQTFAIPLNYVEEAIGLDLAEVEALSGAEVIRIRGAVVPLVRVGNQFGLTSSREQTSYTAVVVTLDGRRVALLVDRVLRRQEIVVKSSGEFLCQLRHLGGGTIGGDGGVYFIVDVPSLIGQHESSAAGADVREAERNLTEAPLESRPQRAGRWVLVVDDSISVRKVAKKLLVAAGYDVDLAVDGLDALEYLRQNKYEAVLTDLEMPQMHGYELVAEIRRLKETRDLPILVVTSRTGEKHVQKARELGANGCLGKPFTQSELTSNLERVIREKSAMTV